MTIDWDKLEGHIDSSIENAAKATDDKLASKIAAITRLTNEEVKALFPEPSDVKKLAELIKIVKSAEARNDKINKIVADSEKFAGIVLTLLSKFV